MIETPEKYFISGTPFVPGSPLPVLVYRGAVASCQNEDEVKTTLEMNQGWIKGGAWNAWFQSHYHPNVHECYGVAKGWSELSIGRGPLDNSSKGQLIMLKQGDVMIIPAGVSHCSSTSSENYRFVVLFPKEGPKWESVWCRDDSQMAAYKDQSSKVAIPRYDPIDGLDGYLVKEWKRILGEEIAG